MTPSFPKMNVLINGMPACATGDGPQRPRSDGFPAPPSLLNLSYWRRQSRTSRKRDAGRADTAGEHGDFGDPVARETRFRHRKVISRTGVDTSSWSEREHGQGQLLCLHSGLTDQAADAADSLSRQPGSAIGSPSVTVNGGPLAFVAPLMGTSCGLIMCPTRCRLGSATMVGEHRGDG